MPYGYLGTTPNQQLNNSGVFSVEEALALKNVGELGGSLELIQTQTPSSAASIEFTSLKENKFDVHFLTYEDVLIGTDNQTLIYQLSNNGGTSYITTGYQYAGQFGNSGGTFFEHKSTDSADVPMCVSAGTSTNERVNGYTYYYNLGDSSKYSFSTYQATHLGTTTNYTMNFGGGCYPTAETHNAIKISNLGASSSITGTFKLYGVKQI